MTAILFKSTLGLALLALTSCVGYHLGGTKPTTLADVRRIAVPMFSNTTMHPRAEAIATSAVADAISADGTYRISEADQADAILEGTVRRIDYNMIRATRLDTLRPEELANSATIEWTLRDSRNPTRVLALGTSSGTSQLFVTSNLQTARNNALPEALSRAAEALTSSLANGF
jgi:hypothetical protein